MEPRADRAARRRGPRDDPGVGQGAAQAIEDAVVLADELTNREQIADALTQYEAIRRPRAELVLKLSRRVDRSAQLENPLGRRLRNALAAHIPVRVQQRQLAAVLLHREQ